MNPSRRAFVQAAAACGLAGGGLACTGAAWAAPIAPGTHRLDVPATQHGVNAEPLPVHLHLPAAWSVNGPVALVMHGRSRDAARYLASWRALSEETAVAVAVPEFTEAKFPGTMYGTGNVRLRGVVQPRSRWLFSLIDDTWSTVRQATGAVRQTFALYGHSAGAQFSHRYLLMAERTQASLLVAANAGSYLMPDDNVNYPFGLRQTGLSADDLRRAYARPVVILLGEADTDPNHPSLPSTPDAKAQGPHRLARGQRFFAESRMRAEAMGAPFNWRLATVPGADHDDAKMGPTAMRLIREAKA